MLTALVVIGVVAVIGQGILIGLVLVLIRTFGQFTESMLLLNSSLLGLFTDAVRHRIVQDKPVSPSPAPFTSDESNAA